MRLNASNTGGVATRRPTLFVGDFAPGDTPYIERVVEGVPTGNTIKEARLTFKNLPADADPGVLQLLISPVSGATGHITDTGADGVGFLRFTPTTAQTALLVAGPYYEDIQVTLDNGDDLTGELARFRPWVAPLNAWEGSHGSHGLIRSVSPEPSEGQPWPYENELLDDFVAGDVYGLRRYVYGLAAGRTVTQAELLIDGLPAITITAAATASGKIEDTGSGAPRRADVRFALTEVQTALIIAAKGWRIRVTQDDGRLFTVLRGTIVSKSQVTSTGGTGAASVATVEVTPDPFAVQVGNTVQLTAVARDSGGTIIPGVVFTWSSQTPATASVNSSGLVTGVAVGAATIRATAPNLVFDDAGGTVSAAGDSNLPPNLQGTVAWAFDPSLITADAQTGNSYIGPAWQRGSAAGSDSNDPAHVTTAPARYTYDSDDYIDFGDALDAVWGNANGFVLLMAVELTAGNIAGFPMIVTKDDQNIPARTFAMYVNGGPPAFQVFLAGGGHELAAGTVNLTVGRHTIGVRYDRSQAFGSRLTLYVDGAPVGASLTTSGGDGAVADTAIALRLGLRASGSGAGPAGTGVVYAWPDGRPATHANADIAANDAWIRGAGRGWA